jgi:hypothetical protein
VQKAVVYDIGKGIGVAQYRCHLPARSSRKI